MAKIRKMRDFLGNGKRVQIVMSEPEWILKGKKYLSPKGVKLLTAKAITKDEAWEKYGKNRYRRNPNAVPVKKILHTITQ